MKTREEYIQNAQILIEALPYIKRFKDKTVVIKYGGSAMTDETVKRQVMRDISLMKLVGMNPVIVHGGGKAITRMLEKMEIESRFEDGMRVTDEETAQIAQMVLAGKINKDIVNYLQAEGIEAAGISGHDGKTFEVEPYRPNGKDLGFVGSITSVNTELIDALIAADFVPVIAPVGTDSDCNSYNINADFAATAIAKALHSEKLIFMSDVEGVYGADGTLINRIHKADIDGMIAEKTITGGMIPKLNSCKDSLQHGVSSVHIIDGRVEHSLLLEIFTDYGIGTMIY
jgi:acetylglutamate kinase